jgi:exopolysaccharide biosynthesis polyprenyl glycosylphosphotransferase
MPNDRQTLRKKWLAQTGGQAMMQNIVADQAVSIQRQRHWSADLAKRLTDLLIACFLIVFTLPLMLIVALAINCDSSGTVFYRQERVGLNGRRFALLKFRSMRQDAEADGRPVWAAARDDRITRIGRFIRLTRIDELPQLFNVLRGDMSLVGPRPERPHFVDHLGKIIPSYNKRHTVLPGITGWAQVNYPYGASVEDARQKLAYDLYYIANRSLLLDLRILRATVGVVIFQKGAR